ncbi:hypothetical protein F5Y16DRAFT_150392 [Xylariaceae sp. FL0255]|nr:hypothetical protein F5Y16DRAFT_150392 [Xylariaceae sp. FL0255]
MPPRIPGAQRLNSFSLCLRPAIKPPTPALLPLTQTASISQREKRRLAKRDPYRWAQMEQRKNAHLEKRKDIEAARSKALGDPVKGIITPFIESFESAGQAPLSTVPVDLDGKPIGEAHTLPTSPHVLNHLIRKDEFDSAIENARVLSQPVQTIASEADPMLAEKNMQKHDEQHAVALEALERITHLDQGSSKDRRHANIRRIIETFGRHETDVSLPPKPLVRDQVREERPVRGGPDTGSSEVQIAILTTKIHRLAKELETGRGYKDKVGKRDLRLMVHKRQRLLQYMERKERGSPRWQHMMQTLGLTEANYKGQITL